VKYLGLELAISS